MAEIFGEIQVNESMEITIHKKYKHDLPGFSMLGSTERRTKLESKDMFVLLRDMSKGATTLFWSLVINRNQNTNITSYLPQSTAERRALTKAYKELNELGIIKRVKQGEYLINPRAFIPKSEQYPIVQQHWDSIP